jgi:hypothetical protein
VTHADKSWVHVAIFALAIGIAIVVTVYLLGCTKPEPRPPTAHETAYSVEIHECVDQSETADDYERCRRYVNKKYGIDAGVWR